MRYPKYEPKVNGLKYEPPLSSLRSRALTAEEERRLLPALQPEDL
ncbi:hypothetical protein NPIL_243231, partial [Nephila pilipes]